MIERPKIHIYHGDGKGKTTAAVGLAVRAIGAGNRVLCCFFLKDGRSGECRPLEILGASVRFVGGGKFTFEMTDSELAGLKKAVERFFASVAEDAGTYDMVVLDEVIDAVFLGLLQEDALSRFLASNRHCEIILTGRNPSEKILGSAEYITHAANQKHPFDSGERARTGIEK